MTSVSYPGEQEAFIDGPQGRLETRWLEPQNEPASRLLVVAHAHPLHGGQMIHKVVTTLQREGARLGARAVRFHYRGVGQSEGSFGEGFGEAEDLIAIVKHFKRPDMKLWLAGFSFGSYVCALAAQELKPEASVWVAPAVNLVPFPPTSSIPGMLHIIQGAQDPLVPCSDVQAWAQNQNSKPTVHLLSGADHFFHGQLSELVQTFRHCLTEFVS